MGIRIRREDRPVYRAMTVGCLIVLVGTVATLPWTPEWLGLAVAGLALVGFVLGVAGWWSVRWREERHRAGGKDPSQVS